MAGVVWIASQNGEKVEKQVCASETGCHKHVVIAAHHAGAFMPGVLCADKKEAQIAWDCTTHDKNEYYVLSNKGDLELTWEKGSKGEVPLGALEGGKTVDGEKLYIGRIEIDSSFLSGKIHPSHKTCYIPHEGKEKGFADYEVLCIKGVPVPLQEKK